MIRELGHYDIGEYYGFNQEWYPDFMMNKGGCAATTAAEICIYLKKYCGIGTLYPYDAGAVTFDDFNRFAMEMKPYLKPRIGGVDKLSIYTEGFEKYLRDKGENRVVLEEYGGEHTLAEAEETLKAAIDAGMPVSFLMLANEDNTLYDYIWHWFLLNGYDTDEGKCAVKVATYGESVWLDFARLWNTGYKKKGGMVLFHLTDK